MPKRTKRIQHDENTRKKIQASQLINRLTNHALADEEIMTTSQVNAAKVLLGKILPDLNSITMDATVTEMSHEEWVESLSDGSESTEQAQAITH